ncbi:uncharacterized protein [Onthophagus taurus]|uniref:uncharacterized protein n=1 Tax=Onthophagus taurus TaxID=166361 RepID=UPI0039BEB2E8
MAWLINNMRNGAKGKPVGWQSGPDSAHWPSTNTQDYSARYGIILLQNSPSYTTSEIQTLRDEFDASKKYIDLQVSGNLKPSIEAIEDQILNLKSHWVSDIKNLHAKIYVSGVKITEISNELTDTATKFTDVINRNYSDVSGDLTQLSDRLTKLGDAIKTEFTNLLNQVKLNKSNIEDVSNLLDPSKTGQIASLIKTVSDAKRVIVEELHRPTRRIFARRRTILKGIDDLWQADLIEMIEFARLNSGYKYILVVIDCFSKFLWTRPLKSKNSTDVTAALRSILTDDGRAPRNLQTDQGKEFYNSQFKRLMSDFKINHFSSYSVMKASMAERVIRTVKQRIYKFFSLYGNHKWVHLLEDITSRYNSTKHSTTKMKPSEINSKSVENKLLDTVYNHIKIAGRGKFRVGDAVRISKYKHVFDKGYLPNWTAELFKIVKVNITNPISYLLEDVRGQPIKGAFYEFELQRAAQPNVYLVKVVRKMVRIRFIP